jgi:hypothetical protein
LTVTEAQKCGCGGLLFDRGVIMDEKMYKIVMGTTPKIHVIDVDKIESLEDVKLILKYMHITVQESSDAYEPLKHILKEL